MSTWGSRFFGLLGLLILGGCTAEPLPEAVWFDSRDKAHRVPALKTGPFRVGLQAGHWNMSQLPDELARLRDNQGAYAAGVFEVDINLDVARRVKDLLDRAGYLVDLIPGTIPPSYDADAFISLHVDWSFDGRSGWKIAAPWRPSAHAKNLRESLRASLAQASWPEDGDHVSINMRGFHGFNHRRYQHTVGAHTPAVLLEMGMLTNWRDRMLLTREPQRMAQAIFQGLKEYFRTYDRQNLTGYLSPEYPPMRVSSQGRALLRSKPWDQGIFLLYQDPGTRFVPVDLIPGWVEGYFPEIEMVAWMPAQEVECQPFPWGRPAFGSRSFASLWPGFSVLLAEVPFRSAQGPLELYFIPRGLGR